MSLILFITLFITYFVPSIADNYLRSINKINPNMTFSIAHKSLIFSNDIAEEIYKRHAKCWFRQSVMFCKPKWIKQHGRTYDVHYTSNKQKCFKQEDHEIKFDLNSCEMLIELHYRENDLLNMWIKNLFFIAIFLYSLPQQMHDSQFVYCVFLFTCYQIFGFGDNHSSEPRRVI